ncbi:hypothetical protein QYE76_053635 [Lolium multiflorum]|uniref:RNase H type-1 domain-containing protein n=1 Tax=Lolium multiflorum TaxID=4521 RepID=A0AAD8SW61_LOLMU|nr:hypothetical protein QYE76_053635 [Lolium multiflorum]
MSVLATPIAQNADAAATQVDLEAQRQKLLSGAANIVKAQQELNLTLREYNAAHGFASVSAHPARVAGNRLKGRNLDQDLRREVLPANATFKELKQMLATTPVLASPLEREPMMLYIAATNRVVSVVVVVEREEEGKTVQRPVYYLSEVLSLSKKNYPHFQKMTYRVFMAATKLKHYFKEHPMKVVSEAPISKIMGNNDASGRIAKWAIQLSPYVPAYERRDAIKSQALAYFLVDWAEMQYKPPKPEVDYWKMHFDGSKLKEGLGAGVVLTLPKGDHLRYVLQIHFRASNNVAEHEALVHELKVAKEVGVHQIICYGDSDLVVQQCSGDWDAKDANMAAYRFHVQKVAGFFEGCEFHHVPQAENEATDTVSKLGSSRREIPPGIALAHLRKPSIKPSPESESIFVPESHIVQMDIDEGNPGTASTDPGTLGSKPEETMMVDDTSPTNPTKEIFSELDEINAQYLIFPGSFQSTEEARGEPGGPTPQGGAAKGRLWCGSTRTPPRLPPT